MKAADRLANLSALRSQGQGQVSGGSQWVRVGSGEFEWVQVGLESYWAVFRVGLVVLGGIGWIWVVLPFSINGSQHTLQNSE